MIGYAMRGDERLGERRCEEKRGSERIWYARIPYSRRADNIIADQIRKHIIIYIYIYLDKIVNIYIYRKTSDNYIL